MLRIERAIQTLKSKIEFTVLNIDEIKVIEGDYKCSEITTDRMSSQSLPWFLNAQDRRFFMKFSLELPTFQEGYIYYFEVSTGREGSWDAVNPQFLAYVNGVPRCGLDVNHRIIILEANQSCKSINIGLHLYTGMASGDLAIRIVLKSRNIDFFNAYHDLYVAAECVKSLPACSTEREILYERLLEGVYNMHLDNITHFSEWMHENIYGFESLQSLYTVHAIGHTHIDVAWLWDLKQTSEKVSRSYSTALDLQKRYPDYKFMASQPILYEMLSTVQPDIFEAVKTAHKDGVWTSDGAMYLEADCNLISGESMIRQFEFGLEYFKMHFDTNSKVLWLPDVFGYSAALPQILKGFGVEMFITSKISWNETNKLPFDSFMWKGIDGSEIPVQFITTLSMETFNKGEFKTIYEGNFTPSEVLGSVIRHQQRGIQPNVIMPFGYGDGGGGATELMLETAMRLKKGVMGMPKVVMSDLDGFKEAYFMTDTSQLPKWSGELYLEYHRGTYTTNGPIKQKHRRLEDALINAEKLSALAVLHGESVSDDFQDVWKILLLNQFHDILPGTSVKRVYDEAYEQLDRAYEKLIARISNLVSNDVEHCGFVNLNASVFRGPMIVECSGYGSEQELPDGRRIVCIEETQPLSLAKVSVSVDNTLLNTCVNPYDFETPFYCVHFDHSGNISRLYDKLRKRDVLKEGGLGNKLSLYEDRPERWDAWDINADYIKFPLAFDENVELTVLSEGIMATVLKLVKTYKDTKIVQHIYFYKHSERIDFETFVDWSETQVLLRTTFDLEINGRYACYDIQSGHVIRPVDQNHSYNAAMFEVCAQHWGDLSEANYGVTLMSNDKFGYSCNEGILGLTLLKSPTWPNEVSDQGHHSFKYALLPHEGNCISGEVHSNVLNFVNPPLQVNINKFERLESLKGVPTNITLDSFRRLSEGVYQMRFVERNNVRGAFDLKLPWSIKNIFKTRLNGSEPEALPLNNEGYSVTYKPFEIITLEIWELHNS